MFVRVSLAIVVLIAWRPATATFDPCDCDLDGNVPTILDALTAAQLSAGALAPVGGEDDRCDLGGPAGVDILDALVYAQASAGLPVTIACDESRPTGTIEKPAAGATLPPEFLVELRGRDDQGDLLQFLVEVSVAGGPWTTAPAAPGSPHPNPFDALPGSRDLVIDLAALTQPGDEIELRLTVSDATASSESTSTFGIYPTPALTVAAGEKVAFVFDRTSETVIRSTSILVPGVSTPTPRQAGLMHLGAIAHSMSAAEELTVILANGSPLRLPQTLEPATHTTVSQVMDWARSQPATGWENLRTALLTAEWAGGSGPPDRIIVLATAPAPLVPPPSHPGIRIDVIQLESGAPDPTLADLAAQHGGTFLHYP